MSAQLSLRGFSGSAAYAVVQRDADGQFWRVDTSVFEAYSAAHWASYAVALTQRGMSGIWQAPFPAGITAGIYLADYREQVEVGPLVSDLTLGDETLAWTGTARVLPASSVSPLVYGSQGSLTVTYTVHDTDNTTPLPGAAVYVSADSGGTQRSEVQLADALGRTYWQLDPGVVWFWRSAPRRTFVNPDGPKTIGP